MNRRDGRGTTTLVWIDSEEAIIVRWADRATVERVRSEVPPKHRSTGHVRFDPRVRHGGGASATMGMDRDRNERMRQFLADVAAHVPELDDVMVVGPGTVRERLERTLRHDDREHLRARRVRSAASERLTERELVAHVRELVGDAPKRRLPPT